MIPRASWGGLAAPSDQPPDVAILGLPYDGSACWRTGAAEAPRRLRDISHTSPAISELGYVVEPSSLRVRDLGDLEPAAAPPAEAGEPHAAAPAYFARVEDAVRRTLSSGRRHSRPLFLLSIGGDHSVTIPLVRGFSASVSEPFGLVLLDAHPDLFDAYDGSPLSNACPMRRALETGGLSPERLLILGTRSYNTVELEFMREKGIRFLPARQIDRAGVESAVSLARERMAGLRHVYLSLDIDVADPACAPGTGAPVAGGLSSRQLLDLVCGLVQHLPVRAMDMVEIAPALDPTQATLFLGLQVVFETFAVLASKAAP